MSESHSHRSAFTRNKKPFKGKSKGKLKRTNKGKVEGRVSIKAKSTMAKEDRTNRNKMLQKQKRDKLVDSKRMGRVGKPPQIVALVPLTPKANSKQVIEAMKTLGAQVNTPSSHPGVTCITCKVDGTQQKFLVFDTPRDYYSVLDICAVADIVLPIVTADDIDGSLELGVDGLGYHMTRLMKAQGMPSLIGLYQMGGLEEAPQKKKTAVKRLFTKYFSDVFEENPKVLPADTPADCKQLLRWIRNLKLKEPSIRQNRSYMLVESVNFNASPHSPEVGELELCGFSRGMTFNPNELVHLPGFNDYQLSRIDSLVDSRDHNNKDKGKEDEAMGGEVEWTRSEVSVADPTKAQDLIALEELDTLNNEQSWITDEEIKQAEMEANKKRTPEDEASAYSQVWNEILSDEDDEDDDDDIEGGEDDDDMGSNVGMESGGGDNSDMVHEKKNLERNEVDFPDEVDTPREGRASLRFAKYRGLKSFRHSEWDKYENLPLEYGHLSQFENFDITKNTLVQTSIDSKNEPGGTRSILCVKNFRAVDFQAMCGGKGPVVVWSLFPFEQKVSVMHFQVRRNQEYEGVVKNKDPMVFQVGFRRTRARPIYSQHSTNADKHQVERYFHQGRFTIASIYSRITFPPGPVLQFLPTDSPEVEALPEVMQAKGGVLVANGSLFSVDPSRMNIKRIVLTGYPVGINKRAAIIRHMFWNPEDVRWFKPVEIWTKYGHTGHIREPRGTKGLMKCIFSGFVKSNDTVCMSLYKRQYPPFDKSQFE